MRTKEEIKEQIKANKKTLAEYDSLEEMNYQTAQHYEYLRNEIDILNWTLNEPKTDPKLEMEIDIKVQFITNKDCNDIDAAIKKGIYYGLDVKGICSPEEIRSIKIY